MSLTWDGLINGISVLGSPQGDGVSAKTVGSPSQYVMLDNADSQTFASPAPASEDALAGTENAPELSATTGGIREKEDGACAECRPSSPGQVSDVADVSPVPASAGGEVSIPVLSSPLQISCGTTDKPRGVHQSETYDARLASPMPQERIHCSPLYLLASEIVEKSRKGDGDE